MKINRCQFCDSTNISRSRYFGASFIVTAVMTLGLALFGTPWLAVTVTCKDCAAVYIAS